jgi:hypothetical protein
VLIVIVIKCKSVEPEFPNSQHPGSDCAASITIYPMGDTVFARDLQFIVGFGRKTQFDVKFL